MIFPACIANRAVTPVRLVSEQSALSRFGMNFILSGLGVFWPAAKASSSRSSSNDAPDLRGSQSLTSTFWLKALPRMFMGAVATVDPSVTLRIWADSDSLSP